MVVIKRKDFEALVDVSLIWTCIEPTIQQIRGRNFAVKSEVYASLSPGLRALLMVQVLYGHTAKGVEEFYSHLSYLLTNEDVWSQLKKGMQYFGDTDMFRILEKMEIVFQGIEAEEFDGSLEQRNVLIADPDKKADSSVSMSVLNKALRDTLPLTVKLVATYIRNNADEFVQFID